MATRPLSATLQEYARGIAGGLLFAIAPLYTMEIWWQGYTIPPGLMLVSAGLMFGVLVAYTFYSGLRDDRSLLDNVLEAMETVAIGTILAVIVLKLAGQLPPDLGFYEAFARVTAEGSSVSIGVAVGSAQLGVASDDDIEKDGTVWHEIALSTLGALLVAVGLAPTQEIVVIAVTAPPATVLATALISFLLALSIINYSEFRGSDRLGDGIFPGGALGDAFVTYGLALAVAALLRWVGGGFDDFALLTVVNQIVFLGVATTLGASAGRLLL